jgi:mannose/fructose/N-acetylgalactosamine-specific phosphotransferase system component IIB
MPFQLVRVDDRLIHGQVTVAWGSWLNPDRIVLVNDEVAGCDWRCELYADSDSLGVPVAILTREAFKKTLAADEWKDEQDFLIVESPADLLDLIRGGLEVREANIGGMHHAEGKRELLPYLFVDGSDVDAMREIIRLGTKLEARDVPQAQSRDVAVLLRGL